jgi:alkylation response protein AidB-like acyl-CoA dehydrogenase
LTSIRLPEVTAALAARAEEHDRAGSLPADGIGAVHAAGLLTATVPERYGDPGAGLAETVDILHALGRGDPSVALITAMTRPDAHALGRLRRGRGRQAGGRRRRIVMPKVYLTNRFYLN